MTFGSSLLAVVKNGRMTTLNCKSSRVYKGKNHKLGGAQEA